MENSAYMPTSLSSPSLMVLASTAEASRDTIHMQPGTPAFPGQTLADAKDMQHIPFTTASFTGMRSVFGQPDGFPNIPAHLLHLHNPFLAPGLDRSLGFISTTGSGAFRPVSAAAANANPDDRVAGNGSGSATNSNGFHSAFVPGKAVGGSGGSKLDVSAANFSHSLANDGGGGGVSAFSSRMSPLGVKEESSDKETSSSLDLQDRLTETPASDVTDGTERSTPDEGRSLRITKFKVDLSNCLSPFVFFGAKKRSVFDCQGCCCPVCGVTLRAGEVESHFAHEVDRLHKISRSIKKSRDSQGQKSSPPNSSRKNKDCVTSSSSSSSSCSSGDKNSPESRWETYLRVKSNRQNRLSARARGKKRKQLDETICPVCSERLTGTPEELNSHVEHCLRKKEADCEEDEPVDVEGESYEEYEWAGQTRIRATSLLQGGYAASGFQTSSCRNVVEDQDVDLNVDGDDTDTYGQPQYNEVDVIPCTSDEPDEIREREALRGALVGHSSQSNVESSKWSSVEGADVGHSVKNEDGEHFDEKEGGRFEKNVDPQAVIKTLKAQLEELETQSSKKMKCLICMCPYTKPLVSVSCWHVHCEECWLRTLGAKKLCPQCNMITSPQDLRRIYL